MASAAQNFFPPTVRTSNTRDIRAALERLNTPANQETSADPSLTLDEQGLESIASRSEAEGAGSITFRGQRGFLTEGGELLEEEIAPTIQGAGAGLIQPDQTPRLVTLGERLSTGRPARKATIFDRFGELSAEEQVLAAEAVGKQKQDELSITAKLRSLNVDTRQLRNQQSTLDAASQTFEQEAESRRRSANRQPSSRGGDRRAAQLRKEAERILGRADDLRQDSFAITPELRKVSQEVNQLLAARRTVGQDDVELAALKIQEMRETEGRAPSEVSKALTFISRDVNISSRETAKEIKILQGVLSTEELGLRVSLANGELELLDTSTGEPLTNPQINDLIASSPQSLARGLGNLITRTRLLVAKQNTLLAQQDNLRIQTLSRTIPTGLSAEEWTTLVKQTREQRNLDTLSAIQFLKERAVQIGGQ